MAKNICAVFGAVAAVGASMYMATRPVIYPPEERSDQALLDETGRLFARRGYKTTTFYMIGRFPGETSVIRSLQRENRKYVGEAVCELKTPCQIKGGISSVMPQLRQ